VDRQHLVFVREIRLANSQHHIGPNLIISDFSIDIPLQREKKKGAFPIHCSSKTIPEISAEELADDWNWVKLSSQAEMAMTPTPQQETRRGLGSHRC
jgi:hypothetical protein